MRRCEMPNYSKSRNLFGELSDDIKTRLDRFFTTPNDETWDDVHGIIIGADGWTTFWQAVVAIDHTFPKKGPTYMNMIRSTRWPKVPDFLTAIRALRWAQGQKELSIRTWRVPSSSISGKYWTVARDEEGQWTCECPHWFNRMRDVGGECHHIKRVRHGFVSRRPPIIQCEVDSPQFDKKKFELQVPLATVDDMKAEAAVIMFLLEYGYSMMEVRELRHIPKVWTQEKINTFLSERVSPP